MQRSTSFTSEGVRCSAWTFLPESRPPVPVIVLASGLGSTKSMGLARYAERFEAAGYACLVFDYRHFGESDGQPRQLLSVKRQLDDWRAAIAHARQLPGVDPERVIVWGTSFAGGHALRLAAERQRLVAAIAQCPFTDGIASALAVDIPSSTRVTIAALRDLVGARRGAAPRYLPNAAPPGTAAFMNAPDALPGMEALAEGAPDFDNRLTARSALDILRYRPGSRARDLRCPVQVSLCHPDTVAPDRVAARQLSRSAQVEIRTYPVGHFDIYHGEAFEIAVADQLAFLDRHVPVRTVPSPRH